MKHANYCFSIMLFATCGGVSAQCENPDAAQRAAKATESELSLLQSSQRRAFAEAQATIAAKSAALGWTEEHKEAFLQATSKLPRHVLLDAQKQVEMQTVREIVEDLKKPEIRNDPIQSCITGIRMVSPMRKWAELNRQQVQFILEQVAAAK
jgi:hypothetical protein